ncbi:MAG: hypothetical protein CMJ47_10430 [Planctomyces sp.]|nr:hypothetical protein [Planctomyces sp.]
MRLVGLLLLLVTLLPRHVVADLPLSPAEPHEYGVRAETLRQMSAWVRNEQLDVRAMLLVRRGRLVFEWYSAGVTREHNHNVFSVTKTAVATLTGVAITERRIGGVNETVGQLLPAALRTEVSPELRQVTLSQLLTMRGGFPVARGNQPQGSPQRELFNRLHAADNRGRFILKMELARPAGQKFAYNNVEPQLVASLLEEIYQTDLRSLSKRLLFDPLGCKNVDWQFADSAGGYPGGYGLRLRAIDMAMLGELYYIGGNWQGRQLLTPEWCRAATSDHTGTGYGYFWWTEEGASGELPFAAKGVRGQRIYVDPKKDFVFVLAADLPPDRAGAISDKLITEYVRPSIIADGPLPPDAAESRKLENELRTAAGYQPPGRGKLPKARLPQRPEKKPSLPDSARF